MDGGMSQSGCCSGTQRLPLALGAHRGCAAQGRASLPQRTCSQIIQATHNSWKTKIIKSNMPALIVGICTPSCPSHSPNSIKIFCANSEPRVFSPVVAAADVAFAEMAE